MSISRSSISKSPSISEDLKDQSEPSKPPLSSTPRVSKKIDQELKEKESQLAGLKAEIQSRQRILALNTEKTSDTEKFKILEEEVSLRDRQIQVLNDRLIVLDSQLKELGIEERKKERDLEMEKLKGSLMKISKEKSANEERFKVLQENWNGQKKSWETEQESYKRTIEIMEKSSEGAKAESEKYRTSLAEAQAEIGKLRMHLSEGNSTIAQQSVKISQMAQEYESMSANLFELNLKIRTNSELQRSITELNEALKKSDLDIKSRCEELERLSAEKRKLENVCFEQAQRVEEVRLMLNEEAQKAKELENLLKMKENSHQGQVENITKQLVLAVNQLKVIKTELEEKKTLEEEVKKRLEENNTAQNRIRSLESALREKDSIINTTKAQEQTLKDRIRELELTITSLKTDKKQSDDNFSSKFSGLKQQIENLQISLKVSEDNLSLKTSENSKLSSQLNLCSAKCEELKKSAESANSKFLTSEQKLKTHKQKISSLENELFECEKTVTSRDSALKELISKLSSIESENFSKDSIILQKDSTILKLGKEIEENKKILQQANSKFRQALAEEIRKFESILESKETEITLLKGMMRSGQTQLKQKEGELHRMKNALQPQGSKNNLENKKSVENFPVIEKFQIFFKGVEELKAFKESGEGEGLGENIQAEVERRFSGLLSDLQKGVRGSGDKVIEVKAFAGKIVSDKEDLKVRKILELCTEMCP